MSIRRVTAGVNHTKHKDPNGQAGGEVVLGVVYTGGYITGQRGLGELLGDAWFAYAESVGIDPLGEIGRLKAIREAGSKAIAEIDRTMPGLAKLPARPRLVGLDHEPLSAQPTDKEETINGE